jgi:hypothetical protein
MIAITAAIIPRYIIIRADISMLTPLRPVNIFLKDRKHTIARKTRLDLPRRISDQLLRIGGPFRRGAEQRCSENRARFPDGSNFIEVAP